MKNPLVSVVIPVYNSASTIEACLGSVIGQSFKDFEVVVVDNNSTDGTRSMVKRAQKKDGRVRCILEKVQGRGPARNKGLRSAKGEVMAWTDSDCTVPSDWLEKLARPILDGKADAVQGGQSSMVDGLWSRLAQRADLRHFGSQVYKKKYIDHVDTKNLGIRKSVWSRPGASIRGFVPLRISSLRFGSRRPGARYCICLTSRSNTDIGPRSGH